MTVNTHTIEIPVLIVGGGPTGLATALCLGRLGIASLLVERRAGTSRQPKARGVTIRSMELLRAWGLASAVRAASLSGDGHRYVYIGRGLDDPAARRVLIDDSAPDELSPEQGAICAQTTIEPLLLDAVRTTGHADLRFGWDLLSFSQDDNAVTAQLRERVGEQLVTVRAAYMVAADGGRSSVRETLGIGIDGETAISHNQHMLIEADLDPFFAERPCRFFFIDRSPALRGMVATTGTSGRWLVNRILPVAEVRSQESEVRRVVEQAATVREMIGIEIPFQLLDALEWTAGGFVAERMQVGRVFLAGDAAHVATPAGGFGMNTGLQDAHNLAWKLAAVLTGQAGPGLLDSYERERLPVAHQTVAMSVARLRSLNISAAAGSVNEISVGLDLGYRYEEGALIADGSAPPQLADPVAEYQPVARPGHRAPHRWLDAQHTRSTLDHFGAGFVLLTGSAGQAWITAAQQQTIQPLPVHLAPEADTIWHETYGITHEGAVLVRPDGFVAWRQPHGPASAHALRDALAAILQPT